MRAALRRASRRRRDATRWVQFLPPALPGIRSRRVNYTGGRMGPRVGRRCMGGIAAALLLFVAGCTDHEALGPKIQAWGTPPPPTELSGTGSILSGTDEITFTFDVKSDLTGSFSALMPSSGATLNTPPGSVTKFRTSSSFCANPANGAEFDAVGQLVEPLSGVDMPVAYTVRAC